MEIRIVKTPAFEHEGEEKCLITEMFSTPAQLVERIQERMLQGAKYMYMLDAVEHPIFTNKSTDGRDIFYIRHRFIKDNKVLPAEDFLLQFENQHPRLKVEVSNEVDKDVFYSSAQGAMVTIDVMIEFAKAHVEAALLAASKKAKTKDEWGGNTGSEYCDTIIDENSILNSYPETNIQ